VTRATAPVPHASLASPSPRNSDFAAIDNLLAADVGLVSNVTPALVPSAVNIVSTPSTRVPTFQPMPTLATVSPLHAFTGSLSLRTPLPSLPVDPIHTPAAPISLSQQSLNALANMSSRTPSAEEPATNPALDEPPTAPTVVSLSQTELAAFINRIQTQVLNSLHSQGLLVQVPNLPDTGLSLSCNHCPIATHSSCMASICLLQLCSLIYPLRVR
jgi:hypothetical protein